MLGLVEALIKNKTEVLEISKVLCVTFGTLFMGVFNKVINTKLISVLLVNVSMYDTIVDEIVRTGTALSVVIGVVYVAVKTIILIKDNFK